MHTLPDISVSLRPASRASAHLAALLGPSASAAERVARKLQQIDTLIAEIEDLGGRNELFAALAAKCEEMRIEGEAMKMAAGLPSAFSHLPSVRETDDMVARDAVATAPS